jgi:hypothetical protein
MTSFRKKGKFVVIIVLFLLLRLPGLGSDITNSDATRWHRRSSKFLEALKQNELISTYQHYQPGVTLMWLNSVVKQIDLSYQRNFVEEIKSLENSNYYPKIHGISKSAMVLVLLTLLFFQMHAIKDLFEERVALFYGFLIATEPFLAGIDRWFHLTSFETFFAFTSFLMLLLWKRGLYKYSLHFSAIFFSLAVYSKLTAAVIAPVLLLVFLSEKKSYRAFGNFVIISLATFVLLLPALWVEPQYVLSKFYGAITNAITSDVRITQLNQIASKFFYPLVLGFKLSPLALTVLVIAVINFKKVLKFQNIRFVLFYILFYFGALSLSDKKIDRYTLALFPPLLLIVSVYISKLKKGAQRKFVILSLLFTIWVASTYGPVYSAYYSPLFGGGKKALEIGIFENSGEFFAQAAQYLNEKEEKLLVAVPNNIDAFSYHYKGFVHLEPSLETDYVVWSHDIDRKNVPEYENCSEIEKELGTYDLTYVYIFKCSLR